MRYFVVCILFFVVGCGYQPPGASDAWVGGDARTVYVRLFKNMTAEPYLDNYITDALVGELSRSRVIILTENKSNADLHLVGSVDRFKSNALAYSATDKITDYRANMSVSVQLIRDDIKSVVWKDKFRRTEDYLANVDKNLELDGQRLAAKLVAERIAEDIHAHMLNSF